MSMKSFHESVGTEKIRKKTHGAEITPTKYDKVLRRNRFVKLKKFGHPLASNDFVSTLKNAKIERDGRRKFRRQKFRRQKFRVRNFVVLANLEISSSKNSSSEISSY